MKLPPTLRQSVFHFKRELRLELRSRTTLSQILPFSAIVLILVAFIFNLDTKLLQSTAAAIFWIVTTFSVIFSVTRSMRVEFENKALEGQLVYGASAVAIYVGKVVGQSLILFAADLVVAGITFVLYGVSPGNFVLLVLATLLATMGLSAIGLLYGALIGESRGGEGLLPLLLLPIALPILVAATKTWQDSLGRHGSVNDPWLKVIALFSLVFLAVGAVLFGVLLED